MSRITFTRPDGTAVAVGDEATFLEALEAKFAEWKQQINNLHGSPIEGLSDDAKLFFLKSLVTAHIADMNVVDEYQFYKFLQLSSVDMPNVTSVEKYAFYNCAAINNLNIPSVEVVKERAFEGCAALTELELGARQIDNNAFRNCKGLVHVNLPEVTTVGNSAFMGCSSLVSFTAPKLLEYTTEMMDSNRIQRLYFPNMTKVNSYSFGLASNPGKVIVMLPALTTIAGSAKMSSKNNLRIVLPQNRVVTLENATGVTQGTGIYCVPANLLEQYKAATNWSSGTQFIQTIEDDPDILAYMAEVGYDYTPTTAEVSA